VRMARPHRALAPPAVAEPRSGCSDPAPSDWAGDWRSFTLLWGFHVALMLVAAFLEPVPRAVIWMAMLMWMGGACLANARRCCRTHCHFTGPFLIVMAAAVAAYAGGLLDLGDQGWALLGDVALVGALCLWWASERVWGTFTGSRTRG